MVEKNRGDFTGFYPEGLNFFSNLGTNNSRAWFEAHRRDYEESLLKPLTALAVELEGFMLSIDPDFVTLPSRVVSRIYRDTRFSHDKSPYKTKMWITFKRQVLDWRDTPCYFFELAADSYRFGMGFYHASKETMDRLRKTIERKPAQFRQAVAFLDEQDTFVLEGEMYRRMFSPDQPEDLRCWHQRKNLYLVCNRQPDKFLFTRELLSDLCKGFGILAPFYDYLWEMK